MVFNPIYIGKNAEGDSQSFAGVFTNQKPSYLFSDIIKVSLAQLDQANNPEINVVDNHIDFTDENMISISDAEVGLFEKLAKLNFANINNETGSETDKENEKISPESLIMYLKGLTGKDGKSSEGDSEFEIDKSDLSVILSLIAGNLYNPQMEETYNGDFEKDFAAFSNEIDSLLKKTSENPNEKVVISLGDLTVGLQPKNSNKLIVNVGLTTNDQNCSNVTPAVKPESESAAASTLPKEDSSVMPVNPGIEKLSDGPIQTLEYIAADNSVPVETNPTEAPKVENAAAPHNTTQTEAGKVAAEILAADESTNTAEKTTHDTVQLKEAPKVDNAPKLIFQKSTNEIQVQKPVDSNAKTDIKPVSTFEKLVNNQEFFDGQLKVEVIETKPESLKQNLKVVSENVDKPVLDNNGTPVTENLKTNQAQPKIFNINQTASNEAGNSNQNIPLPKNAVPMETVKEVVDPEVQSTNETAGEFEIKKPAETKSDDSVKHLQFNDEETKVKLTDLKSEKINSADTKVTNTDQPKNNTDVNIPKSQNAEAAPVARNQNTEKYTDQKIEVENSGSVKEKVVKISGNKDADQTKQDGRQNNTFDKNTAVFNKVYSSAKQFADTVKVVDRSYLMKELESVIKSSDKKNVKFDLYPEKLGSVKVSLDVTDKMVTAKIQVANEAVRQIILSQADVLKSSLIQSGIQLAGLNVSVNSSGDRPQQNIKTKKREINFDKKAVAKDTPTKRNSVKNLGYNTYDYIA